MKASTRLLASSLLLSLGLTSLSRAEPLTAERFVQLRCIREASLSPDGQSLAYTLASRTPLAPHFDPTTGNGTLESEVWVKSGEDRSSLAGSAVSPSWSPDGSALGLLQADAQEARLKVWWRKTKTWAVLHHAALGSSAGAPSYVWLDDHRVLAEIREAPLVTASETDPLVLDSKQKPPIEQGQLVEWNPDTGASRTWVRGRFAGLYPSPDSRCVAALQREASGRDVHLLLLGRTGQSDSGSVVDAATLSGVRALRWAPDSHQFCVQDGAGQWWTCNAADGKMSALPLEVRDCIWLGNKLVTQSGDWQLNGRTIMPGTARLFSAGDHAVTVSGSQVSRLAEDGSLSALGQLPSSAPCLLESGGAVTGAVPVVLRQGDSWSELRSDSVVTLTPPGAEATVASLTPGGSTVMLLDGSQTRLTDGSGKLWAEQTMPDPGDRLTRVGTSSDWMLLPPPSFRAPYPTVVWLDPNQKGGSAPSATVLSNRTAGLNAHLLSAQGYAVYFPQVELNRDAEPGTQLQRELTAANERIRVQPELDSNRMAVAGQGLGGFAALLACTQDQPYKAALALDAFVDPLAEYCRSSKPPLPGLLSPWKDPQTYMRNSPLYQADRVHTPVLLVNGRDDSRSAQAEQFYSALARQGKDARLVRYPNEGEQVSRAEHVVHEWNQIHLWLARYL